ncbi:hypothetical protein EJB05_05442, partial [Eragrostis curvula]
IDLNNVLPEVDEHVDWSTIDEWEGPAHELQYDMVWEEANIGQEEGHIGDDPDVEDQEHEEQDAETGHQSDGHIFDLNQVPEGEEDHVTGAHNNVSGGPANAGVTQTKKRRFYKDDEKLAIYAELF